MTPVESRSRPRVFISCGDVSGETHGANLARDLKKLVPDIELIGFGGRRLEASGCRVLYDLVDLAVMGVRAVLAQLGTFFHVLRLFYRLLEQSPPDLIVLVDYPGLNFKLAQIARTRGIPVVYYICPQLWAWGLWRMRRARRLIDEALAILPFEKAFFDRYGLRTEYVGHPLLDHLDRYPFDRALLADLTDPGQPPVMGLLPGSRRQEIEANLPVMLEVARRVSKTIPVRFVIPPAKLEHVPRIEAMTARAGIEARILPGNAHEVMKAARFCLVTSGTAVLELAYLGTPLAVVYRTPRLAGMLRHLILSVPYIASINLIAGEQAVPEFCGHAIPADALVRIALELIPDGPPRQRMVERLERLRPRYDRKGASSRAAEIIATKWLARQA